MPFRNSASTIIAAVAALLTIIIIHSAAPPVTAFHYLQSNVVVAAMYRSSNAASTRSTACPKVRPFRNFQLPSLMGEWHVIQYYASAEEAPEYSCMRCVFSMAEAPDENNSNNVTSRRSVPTVQMNFTYTFRDDPLRERLQGNITWSVPDFGTPSHWVHAEDPYEGVYNTYVLDTDGKGWALIMHCAEKTRTPRYLSALLLARERKLGPNVISFLRDKLLRYDIDVQLLFGIDQMNCDATIERVYEEHNHY